jgi:hypothetical protein
LRSLATIQKTAKGEMPPVPQKLCGNGCGKLLNPGILLQKGDFRFLSDGESNEILKVRHHQEITLP